MPCIVFQGLPSKLLFGHDDAPSSRRLVTLYEESYRREHADARPPNRLTRRLGGSERPISGNYHYYFRHGELHTEPIAGGGTNSPAHFTRHTHNKSAVVLMNNLICVGPPPNASYGSNSVTGPLTSSSASTALATGGSGPPQSAKRPRAEKQPSSLLLPPMTTYGSAYQRHPASGYCQNRFARAPRALSSHLHAANHIHRDLDLRRCSLLQVPDRCWSPLPRTGLACDAVVPRACVPLLY